MLPSFQEPYREARDLARRFRSAALTGIGQVAHVVTYTGDLGYWIALYRGHKKGLIELR